MKQENCEGSFREHDAAVHGRAVKEFRRRGFRRRMANGGVAVAVVSLLLTFAFRRADENRNVAAELQSEAATRVRSAGRGDSNIEPTGTRWQKPLTQPSPLLGEGSSGRFGHLHASEGSIHLPLSSTGLAMIQVSNSGHAVEERLTQTDAGEERREEGRGELSDEQLLTIFPEGSCFIAEVNGKKMLVFRDAEVRAQFFN